VAKKRGHSQNTQSNLNRFRIFFTGRFFVKFAEFFFTGRFFGKFAVKWILKIPLLPAYVATLPCETLMSAKKPLTTNYKVV